MQHQRLFIDGSVGRLQALYRPAEDARAVVVVCHPHPGFGGTMQNKVVYWMARAFEDAGCAVLRFNFRGVGQSAGAWDEGRGEADDAAAALDWLNMRYQGVPLWLAGFSFGCFAGLQAAHRDARVERMFAVAPAVNLWDFSFMEEEKRPLTVIAGTADEIVPYVAVAAASKLLKNVHLHAIKDAGHFFPAHRQAMVKALLSDVQ